MGSNAILKLVFDDGRENRRQWPRRAMMLSAELVTVGSERGVRVRDLSPGGVRVEGADIPPVGTDVLVRRGGFEGFGTIAWRGHREGGIAFDTVMDEEELQAIHKADLPPPPPPAAIDHRRPGFGRRTTQPRWSHGRGWVDG